MKGVKDTTTDIDSLELSSDNTEEMLELQIALFEWKLYLIGL